MVGCYGAAPAVSAAERPPIRGVAYIAFYAGDLDASRTFYRDLLGYEEPFTCRDAEGKVALAFFKVNDRQYLALTPQSRPNENDPLAYVAFETTDAEAMRAFLGEKGVAVPAQTVRDVDGNLGFTVRDPNGHAIRFVQYLPDSPAAKARRQHAGPDRISDRLLHIGINVKVGDQAAADHFYKDILGFSEFLRTGEPDRDLYVNLRVPEGTDYLEYILEYPDDARSNYKSAHHACLMVPDMQKAIEWLRDRPGVGNLRAPSIGRNNHWLLNLFDPDGTRVELMEPYTTR